MSAQQLHERLRAARAVARLTQAQLGKACDMTQRAISDYEHGASTPNALTIEALAKALNVSPCWLAFGKGESYDRS